MFTVVGIALIVFGIADACIGNWKYKNYDRATGVVTDVDKYVDGDMIARYTRTYTYQVNGEEYEVTESSLDIHPGLEQKRKSCMIRQILHLLRLHKIHLRM